MKKYYLIGVALADLDPQTDPSDIALAANLALANLEPRFEVVQDLADRDGAEVWEIPPKSRDEVVEFLAGVART